MATEIERKFLVAGDGWRRSVERSLAIRQGYLVRAGKASVRIRIRDDEAMLTVKSAQAGMTRSEFEYAIPLADAQEMLGLCDGRIIVKTRHHVRHGGLLWEVDVFAGAHQGLSIAEVELPDAAYPLSLPDWVGSEVTGEASYYNAALAGSPSKET